MSTKEAKHNETYQEFWRKVVTAVHTTKITLIILYCHPFLPTSQPSILDHDSVTILPVFEDCEGQC